MAVPIQELASKFEEMPPQLRTAAQFLIDRPQEVALLSMREQAKRAGVQPATMTRLAKWLGYPGYQELKEVFADKVRANRNSFALHSAAFAARTRRDGNENFVRTYLKAQIDELTRFDSSEFVQSITAIANELFSASHIYVSAGRSMFPVAFHFWYLHQYFDKEVTLLHGIGNTGFDQLIEAGAGAALLVLSVSPYTKATIDAAEFAAELGMKVLSITDSQMSPTATVANSFITLNNFSPSFFTSVSPALAVCETLVSMIAALHGESAVQNIKRREDLLQRHNLLWNERARRKKKPSHKL